MSIKYTIAYTLNGIAQTKPVQPIAGGAGLGLDSENYVYRESFKGKYTFKNIPGDSIFDFDLLKSIEAVDPFTPIVLTVSKMINNTWQQIEQGRFVVADCAINNDLCLMEVTPEIFDAYTCIDDIKDKEYNILLEVPTALPYRILNIANLEFRTCKKLYQIFIGCPNNSNPVLINTINGQFYAFDDINGIFWDVPAQFGTPTAVYDSHPSYDPKDVFAANCFLPALAWIFPTWRIYSNKFRILGPTGILHVYTAEVETTWCAETAITLNNPAWPYAAVPPTGAGWVQYYPFYQGGLLATKWIRQPYYLEWVDPVHAANPDEIYKYYYEGGDCNFFSFQMYNPFTNSATNKTDIYRGRYLNDTIQMFLNKADCGLSLKSEFFQSDINPVTGERNPGYTLNDGSDIKTPLSTASPATINYLTFDKLLENICNIFDLFWYISGSDFVIEHKKYFENGLSYTGNGFPSTDLRNLVSNATGKKEIIKTNKYIYDVANIYKQEKWNNTTYVDYDFSPLFIDYDLQIAKDGNTLTRQIEFVLDAAGIYNNPSSFSNDAIVLIAVRYEVIDPVNNTLALVCLNEPGYRTNEEVVNGWMCLSNLFNRFWRYGRMKSEGVVNALTEHFETETGKIIQTVEVKDCDLNYFKNIMHFTTDLGTGRKKSGEHKIILGTTKIEILI